MSKKQITSPLFVFFAVIWFIIAAIIFITSLKKIQRGTIDNRLTTISQYHAAEIRLIFDRYLETLSEIAKSLDDLPPTEQQLLRSSYITKNNIFTHLMITKISELTYYSDDHTELPQKNPYLFKIKAGKPFVSDIITSTQEGTSEVILFIPIKNKNGNYETVLQGSIPLKKLAKRLERAFTKFGGDSYITDREGKYFSYQNSNRLPLTKNHLLTIEKQIQKKEVPYSFFPTEEYYVYYSFVGINKWAIFIVIPNDYTEQIENQHILNTMLFIIQIVIILALFAFYIYKSKKQQRNTALLNEKCFTLLVEQTNKAIFEWDIKTNNVRYLSDFRKLFGVEETIYTTADQTINAKAVHQDDLPVLNQLYNAIREKRNISNLRFRILNEETNYCWCEIAIAFVKKENGEPYKAMGFIENIDKQVKKEELLRRKSETDQLTEVYNKSTTEYLITTLLEKSNIKIDKHALMIIDIDNYKEVNDRLGHLYGDIVLSQLALSLKSLFRSDDIVGRLGGDEFFVLMKNFKTTKLLIKKANMICEKFRKTYSEGDSSTTISASIGISIFPSHGKSFEELYKAADIALYHVKADGKNNHFIYNGLKEKRYIADRTGIDTVQKSFQENKLEYLFQLLYESENIKVGVTSVLQLIAEQFGLSRANIFNIDREKNSASCEFEWCADNISSVKEMQQDITIDFIVNQLKENHGMFVTEVSDLPDTIHPIYEAMGVKSLLFFAVMDGENIIGNITFQNCNSKTMSLTPKELTELKRLCQVVAVFIFKQRSIEQEIQYRRAIEMILNNMNGLTYVVDKDNWKILFENERIREITKCSNVGKICYTAFQNRTIPCLSCPIKNLTEDNDKAVVEINNTIYNIISKTTASKINWINDKEAYLISSIDITEYKN